MKICYALFVCFVALCSNSLLAQNSNEFLTVSYTRLPTGEVEVSAANSSYIPYTVSLSFPHLSGTYTVNDSTVYNTIAYHGNNKLLTLIPVSENQPISFSYRYTTHIGDYRIKPDTNYVYLMPLNEGKSTRLNTLRAIRTNKTTGQEETVNIGVTFSTNVGDTVVAARSGVVVEAIDTVTLKEEHRATDAENFVRIYHQDGTLAQYKLFRQRGVFVEAGDTVYAGQIIGVAGGENYKIGSHLRFSLYIPDEEFIPVLPTLFLGADKIGKPVAYELYAVEHPDSLVNKEKVKVTE